MNKHLLACALLGLAAMGASAQEQPRNTFYVGGAYISIHSKAPPLALTPPDPTVTDARVKVGDASTLGFGYSYRIDDAWSVEVALGVPPRHKVYGEGQQQGFGQVASVKQAGPTFFANYHFGELMPRLRPFVGAGINYTRFFSTRSTTAGNWAAGGPTDIRLKDSWGLAGHVGATYQIDRQWSVIGTIAAAKVKSDVTATTTKFDGSTSVSTTTIDFRPVAYTLSVGYSF